jgi:predicted anti-sigma-YlaC factor YlaD
MLSCKALAQLHASDYLDHELTPRQRFGVRVHLILCKNCRRFIKQLQVVRSVLQHRQLPLEETQVQSIASRLYSAHDEQNKS